MREFKGTTQQECMLHYWVFIHDMVTLYNQEHGTDIKPWECVKLDGNVFYNTPKFNYDLDCYSFAVAIVEGKPVFVGDRIFGKQHGYQHDWTIDWTRYWDNWTWEEPKQERTFELNGVKLPCTVKELKQGLPWLCFMNKYYYFNTKEDRDIVVSAIQNLLENARDV